MLSTRSTCAVALAAALSLPCFAQSTSPSDTGTAATTGTTSAGTSGSTTASTSRDDNRGDRGNWGWLGLLGLVGLMGLRRHGDAPRVDTTRTSAQR